MKLYFQISWNGKKWFYYKRIEITSDCINASKLKSSFHDLKESYGALEEPYDPDKLYGLYTIFHREDGPAVENIDGVAEIWYLHDCPYRFNEWCDLLRKTNEEKVMLKLRYG